jgi:hypothetical protein
MKYRLRHPLDDAVLYVPISVQIHDTSDAAHLSQPLVQTLATKQLLFRTVFRTRTPAGGIGGKSVWDFLPAPLSNRDNAVFAPGRTLASVQYALQKAAQN